MQHLQLWSLPWFRKVQRSLNGLSVCLQLTHPLVPPTHPRALPIHLLALPIHQPHLVSCPSYLPMQAAYAPPAIKTSFCQ